MYSIILDKCCRLNLSDVNKVGLLIYDHYSENQIYHLSQLKICIFRLFLKLLHLQLCDF